jgi:hypothetical protein
MLPQPPPFPPLHVSRLSGSPSPATSSPTSRHVRARRDADSLALARRQPAAARVQAASARPAAATSSKASERGQATSVGRRSKELQGPPTSEGRRPRLGPPCHEAGRCRPRLGPPRAPVSYGGARLLLCRSLPVSTRPLWTELRAAYCPPYSSHAGLDLAMAAWP